MKFLPYAKHQITKSDIAAVVRVLRRQPLSQGPEIERLEQDIARMHGNLVHVAAVSSGTAALHLAYLAAGIKPGDRVLVSPLTFVATANALHHVGAVPVWCDIDPRTGCLDPKQAEKILSRDIYHAIRAIVPVHYGGQISHLSAIEALARKHGLVVVQDACHAFGMAPPCRSNAICYSLHPAKHVAAGEGGVVVSVNFGLIEKVKRLRNHGLDKPASARLGWQYDCLAPGWNYRMDDMSAALARSQLKRVYTNLRKRQQLAEEYHVAIAESGIPGIQRPSQMIPSAWHLYWIRVPATRRERIFRSLRNSGIGVAVHYPYIPCMTAWRPADEDCPEARQFCNEAITLPLFPDMTKADVLRVVAALARACKKAC